MPELYKIFHETNIIINDIQFNHNLAYSAAISIRNDEIISSTYFANISIRNFVGGQSGIFQISSNI